MPRAFAADGCPEPNDSPEQACELKPGQAVADEIENDNDVDLLRIDVKAGQTVEVTAKGSASVGGLKLRLEDPGGAVLASVGAAPGERTVVAERLPEGRYVVSLSGEGGDPGRAYPYSVTWKGTATDGPIATTSARGSLRDLVLTPTEVGDQATQTGGRLLAAEIGRVYETVYERENTVQARRFGPMYLLDRVHVADSAERAQAVFDAWAISDSIPEANNARQYESLGDQPIPSPIGDISYATGACTTCNDENPLRSYRLVMRFDTVVHVLYSWGVTPPRTSTWSCSWRASSRSTWPAFRARGWSAACMVRGCWTARSGRGERTGRTDYHVGCLR
jgi:hypothetical protein